MKKAIYFSLAVIIFFAAVLGIVRLYSSSSAGSSVLSSTIGSFPSSTPLVTVGLPSRLIIPTLDINVPVEQVALDQEGRMDVPKSDYDVGWYSLGSRPGEIGSAVIAGHYDTKAGTAGVFYQLSNLKTGDKIEIVDDTGKTFDFVVQNNQELSDSSFPSQEVFQKNDTSRLNLITCSGVWDKNANNYLSRTVVFSVLQK